MKIQISLSNAVDTLLSDVHSLKQWLNGNTYKLDPEWIDRVAKMARAYKGSLYRLVLVPKDVKLSVGKVISIESKSKLVSASDKIENAVAAGCSHNAEFDGRTKGKKLAVVELTSPKVCATLQQLLDAAEKQKLRFIRNRLLVEREFLVLSSGLTGKVVHFTDDASYIDDYDFNFLLEQLKSTAK